MNLEFILIISNLHTAMSLLFSKTILVLHISIPRLAFFIKLHYGFSFKEFLFLNKFIKNVKNKKVRLLI